jgi:hypothetical protein
MDVPGYDNTLVFGTTAPASLGDIEHNLQLVRSPLAEDTAQLMEGSGVITASPYHGQVYTDDLAPVEKLIDEIIFNYVTGS